MGESMSRLRNIFAQVCCLAVFVIAAIGETSPAANQDPVYKALRNLKPSGEILTLDKVVLKRDAATYTLSGSVCFMPPVEGKVTGAVFSGSGTFSMEPPLKVEKISLSRLTKQAQIDEEFEHLVLRFTDDTYDELKKSPGAKASTGTCDDGYWKEIDSALHNDPELKWSWNLTARILQDVYSPAPGGLFVAFIKGKKYSGKELFIIDPHGAPDVAPEEVSFQTWGENKNGTWAAFHLAGEYANHTASGAERNSVQKIEKQETNLTIGKSGHLDGRAKTTFTARQDGVRAVSFNLYGTLRAESVTDESGKKLDFVQEDKEQDNQFWVILPKSLKAGEEFTIVTKYGGKDALLKEGNDNYYLVGGARTGWYPGGNFDDYAKFDMRFTYPKTLELVASGTLDKEVIEGSQKISHWVTDEPQTVAAFQFGSFKKAAKQVANISLEAYANDELPDYLASIKTRVDQLEAQGYIVSLSVGGLNTTGMMKAAMAEAEGAVGVYTNYFGPTPYKHLAMTQQTADNYGQAWPQLVWLPLSYFLDGTTRHRLYGFDPRGYFTVVAPHEIAHQWWGHAVTWGSYRDQWMSEGFADASASIYLQAANKGNDAFLKFWNEERTMITERNKEGFRAIDAGPLTLGYRLNNTKVGYNITRELIYPKGAYVLHMIRMLMWNQNTGDQTFKATMQDFVTTYRNKAATTEDFKAMVEKHMLRTMDLDSNGKMDWFFDEYVYGTALPSYRLEHSFDGMVLHYKVTQSGVDDTFQMRVPLYLELADGRMARIGSVPIKGNATIDQKFDLAAVGLKDRPKRLVIAYFDDVLAEKIEQK